MTGLDLLKRIFIYPLLAEKPPHADEREFLTQIFSVNSRSICVYKATKEFSLTGTFMEGGVHPVYGWTGPRRISKGEIVVARKDYHDAFIDLEHDGRVFRLTTRQWAQIGSLLRKTRGQDDLEA